MIRSAIIKERSDTRVNKLAAAKAAYEKSLLEREQQLLEREQQLSAMKESGGPVEKYDKEHYIEYGYDDNF